MNRKKKEIDYYKTIYGKDYKKHLQNTTQSNLVMGLDVQNYEKSVKFATSYIFVLFSSAVCGYYIAKEVLGLDFHNRMIGAATLCYITLMIEIFIFIIKNNKHNKERAKKK